MCSVHSATFDPLSTIHLLYGSLRLLNVDSLLAILAGIFVKDILEAVPIDKYFELFKPGENPERGLGGFIRVTLKTSSSTQPQGRLAAGETHLPPHKTAGKTILCIKIDNYV